MSERAAFNVLLAAGCFLTGAGRYFVGPAIIVAALIYHARFVPEEPPP